VLLFLAERTAIITGGSLAGLSSYMLCEMGRDSLACLVENPHESYLSADFKPLAVSDSAPYYI